MAQVYGVKFSYFLPSGDHTKDIAVSLHDEELYVFSCNDVYITITIIHVENQHIFQFSVMRLRVSLSQCWAQFPLSSDIVYNYTSQLIKISFK